MIIEILEHAWGIFDQLYLIESEIHRLGKTQALSGERVYDIVIIFLQK